MVVVEEEGCCKKTGICHGVRRATTAKVPSGPSLLSLSLGGPSVSSGQAGKA